MLTNFQTDLNDSLENQNNSNPPASQLQLAKINFSNENVNFSAPSWLDLYQLTLDLASQIQIQGEHFDRIVTLAKGGWSMSVPLVDLLDIEQVASIGVRFYTGINTRLSAPQVYQDLPISIVGEKILLFDDVADTGESLKFTLEYLFSHGASSVKTATLLYKPHSSLKPNFYGAQTDSWIIFPYELVESIRNLGIKWFKAGLSVTEISSRLEKFGFKPAWTKPYLTLFLK